MSCLGNYCKLKIEITKFTTDDLIDEVTGSDSDIIVDKATDG